MPKQQTVQTNCFSKPRYDCSEKEKKRKRDHMTPLLNELHWLLVKFRCKYNITTLAYYHFDGTLPSYLSASLCTYQTSCILRSSNEKLLKIPKRNLKSIGNLCFSFIAPTVWNSLPASLQNLPPSLTSKPSSKLYVYVCVYNGMNGVC